MHVLQNLLKYTSLNEQKSNKLCINGSKTNCKFPHVNILREFFMNLGVFVTAFTKGLIAEIRYVANSFCDRI